MNDDMMDCTEYWMVLFMVGGLIDASCICIGDSKAFLGNCCLGSVHVC